MMTREQCILMENLMKTLQRVQRLLKQGKPTEAYVVVSQALLGSYDAPT